MRARCHYDTKLGIVVRGDLVVEWIDKVGSVLGAFAEKVKNCLKGEGISQHLKFRRRLNKRRASLFNVLVERVRGGYCFLRNSFRRWGC